MQKDKIMSLSEKTLTIVMALSADTGLDPLTSGRAKAAVPFGGNYRIIDFTLTNCIRSNFRRILVLTQYNAHSLHKHLRDGWSLFNSELSEYVTAITSQMREGKMGCLNAVDAVKQNTYILERSKDDYVCVVSGEHIYRMDYAAMLEYHVTSGADITISSIEIGANGQRPAQSQLEVDPQGRVISIGKATQSGIATMEVTIFNKQCLLDLLAASSSDEPCTLGFSQQALPGTEEKYTIMTYQFGGVAGRVSPDRYWRNLSCVDSYYEANMDLLQHDAPLDLYQSAWPIRTYQRQNPPARTIPGASCNEGVFINSMVGAGTIISGGGVHHSVLFPEVYVGDAATVDRSILLPGVHVGDGAQLANCIVEKHVVIPQGEIIGHDQKQDARRFTVTERGVIIVPSGYQFG